MDVTKYANHALAPEADGASGARRVQPDIENLAIVVGERIMKDRIVIGKVYGRAQGDRQYVRAGYYDCDMDVLLFVVEQEGGGACHTGERSCFFRAFGSGATPGPV